MFCFLGRIAQEERLQVEGLTVSDLKAQMQKLDLDMKAFNKAKNKQEKKDVFLVAWFKTFQLPNLSAGSGASAQGPVATKKEQLAAAVAFKADVVTSQISEAPEYLAKIILLQEQYLSGILSGEKTLECRKSVICHGPEAQLI